MFAERKLELWVKIIIFGVEVYNKLLIRKDGKQVLANGLLHSITQGWQLALRKGSPKYYPGRANSSGDRFSTNLHPEMASSFRNTF
jgi:hypothetical protein